MSAAPDHSVSAIPSHRRVGRWLWSLRLVAVAVLVAVPGAALAEDAAEEAFHDRLMIRGGWVYVFDASATLTFPGPIGGQQGIGTTIDYAKTLGGDTSTDALRIDAKFRFNPRHSLSFSWYRIGLAGNKTISSEVDIGDTQIGANAGVNSSLGLNLYRLYYDYSFYRSEKAELGLSIGTYIADLSFQFGAQGTINNVTNSFSTGKEQLTLPLPQVGFLVNYNITPKWLTQIRTDFFYLSVGNYSGAMFEFYAGLEYRLFKHFALGAAYDRLQVNLQNNSTNGGSADVSFNLVYVYGTIYAF